MPRKSKTAQAVTKQTAVEIQEEKVISGIVTATKKAAAERSKERAEAKGPEMVLQFRGMDLELATLEGKIKESYVRAGNKASTLKNVKVYLKPEENAAYYVVDGGFTSRVELY